MTSRGGVTVVRPATANGGAAVETLGKTLVNRYANEIACDTPARGVSDKVCIHKATHEVPCQDTTCDYCHGQCYCSTPAWCSSLQSNLDALPLDLDLPRAAGDNGCAVVVVAKAPSPAPAPAPASRWDRWRRIMSLYSGDAPMSSRPTRSGTNVPRCIARRMSRIVATCSVALALPLPASSLGPVTPRYGSCVSRPRPTTAAPPPGDRDAVDRAGDVDCVVAVDFKLVTLTVPECVLLSAGSDDECDTRLACSLPCV